MWTSFWTAEFLASPDPDHAKSVINYRLLWKQNKDEQHCSNTIGEIHIMNEIHIMHALRHYRSPRHLPFMSSPVALRAAHEDEAGLVRQLDRLAGQVSWTRSRCTTLTLLLLERAGAVMSCVATAPSSASIGVGRLLSKHRV